MSSEGACLLARMSAAVRGPASQRILNDVVKENIVQGRVLWAY